MGCLGYGVFGMWDVGNVRCFGCEIIGMCNVRDAGLSGCGMFDL